MALNPTSTTAVSSAATMPHFPVPEPSTAHPWPRDVGVHALELYFPGAYVDQQELEAFDGVSQVHRGGLMRNNVETSFINSNNRLSMHISHYPNFYLNL